MKCQKRPPLKIFAKKDPLRVAAPLARRHVARAAWASAGRPLPPLPNPARPSPLRRRLAGGPCRLPWCRQDDVAPLPPMGAPAPCDPLADSRPAQVPMQKEKSWAGDSFAADSEAADCKLWLLSIKTLLQTTERSTSIAFSSF
jgi:hypothetical protein